MQVFWHLFFAQKKSFVTLEGFKKKQNYDRKGHYNKCCRMCNFRSYHQLLHLPQFLRVSTPYSSQCANTQYNRAVVE